MVATGTIEFAAKAGKIAWTSDKWLYIVATGTIEFAAKAGKIAWTSDKWLYIVATGTMNSLQRLERLLGRQIREYI